MTAGHRSESASGRNTAAVFTVPVGCGLETLLVKACQRSVSVAGDVELDQVLEMARGESET